MGVSGFKIMVLESVSVNGFGGLQEGCKFTFVESIVVDILVSFKEGVSEGFWETINLSCIQWHGPVAVLDICDWL